MAAPNMSTITASIETSLQNFSLDHNHHHHSSSSSSSSTSSNSVGGVGAAGAGRSSASDSPENNSLELNSGIPLPYYWEQCLDLKTGEIYFINWRTGMKSQEDPRTNLHPEDDDQRDFTSGDDTSCDSDEGSSSESTPIWSSSREQLRQYNSPRPPETNIDKSTQQQQEVLVVAGCKSCFTYFMVPKLVGDCPKCCAQLLLFYPSQNGSP